MEDFYSYIKNAGANATKQEEVLNNASEKKMRDMEKTVQDVAKKYENYSENELKEEIIAKVNKAKQDDSINLQEIEQMANNIAPLMNESQKQRLNEILSLIRK